ncbi:MAG: hypothetical protein CO162_03485 [bacterium (Candidatus Ratteibacteria) CG_4_9_14_3_um_filter_41_21]|uniref:V-type ATP synthase subunit C n=2 Tax=Candidatus Ratteibacteria TaxID=2979319 RepID=A0A2M7YG86_9BACT|nr:MAG: hypothetical protein COS11_02705 [bacterium (Candidatus Ratteibacteria) CG01_land_8_20_14_3_00_40_19]PJA61977.1 MAG: hypothetical protein CO162_03485 [bacterium (Candidatus Ratteibacteria) CG_4_9_14_3_um_filter_41_21]
MESYAYAVGKIRVLEKSFFPKSRLEKAALISLEAISETTYFREPVVKEEQLFSLLSNERQATYDLIGKLLENPSLSVILRLKDDLHNLKLLFKKEIDSSISADFSPIGAISPSLLEEAIHHQTFLRLPLYFREIARKSISFSQKGNARELEQFLEKEMWKPLLNKTREIKSPFLENFFKMAIDFLNLENFFSFPATAGEENFSEIFVEGGRLRKELFQEEKSVVEKKILLFYPRLNLEDLEKSTDNLLTDYLKKAKTYTFGIEPLIAYLLAKEAEAKNIKLLLLGKLNNIDSSVLKENLRETYV